MHSQPFLLGSCPFAITCPFLLFFRFWLRAPPSGASPFFAYLRHASAAAHQVYLGSIDLGRTFTVHALTSTHSSCGLAG